MQGLIVVVSGPSGAGKASITKGCGLEIAQSWTTRSPKSRDMPGEYRYVSREEFMEGVCADQLLEHDEHFGNMYGLAKPPEGKVVITDVDVNGALKLRERPDVILVGVLPPDPIVEICLQRLHARGDETTDEILDRKDRIKYESELILAEWPRIIRNDDIVSARQQLKTIIANCCKTRKIPYK